MRRFKILVPITGAGGSAATAAGGVNSEFPVSGEIAALYIDLNGQPNTIDITVQTKGAELPVTPILTVANDAASGWFYPQAPTHKVADGTVITGWFANVAVMDYINIVVAQGNQGTFTIYGLYKDC